MKNFLLILSFLSCLQAGVTQSITFPEDKGITTGNLLPLMLNNELKGYYSFFYKDKNKGDLEFNLLIMDINFKITKDVTVITDRWVRSIDFNGSHFCFALQDLRYVQYNIYDMEGKLTGVRKLDDLKLKDVELENYQTILPVPNQGFIRTGVVGSNQYLEMFDHVGDVKWKINGKKFQGITKYEDIEQIYAIDASDKIVLVGVQLSTSNKKDLGERSQFIQRAYDVQTGQELFDIDDKSGKSRLLHGVNIESDEVIRYGAHFPQGDPGVVGFEWGGSEHGFYMQAYDLTGKLKYEYINNGEEDYKSLFQNPEEAGYNEASALWVHNVLRSRGKYYLIGEMYSNSPKSIHNMLVLEIDPSQSKPIAHVFQKDIVKFAGKTGVMAFQHYNLAYNFRTQGLLDYKFSGQNADHSMFSSVYANFDNSDKSDKNYIVGSISLDREGELVNPKIVLTSKPDEIRLFPGKPGYVAVFEYFKKDKNVSLTLHKFDF